MRLAMAVLALALVGCRSQADIDAEQAEQNQSWATLSEMANRAASAERAPTGTSVNVPSDPRARYWIISESKITNGHLEVVTRRSGPSGESYSRREIDCRAGTVRYIGEGDTLAEAQQDSPNPGEMAIPLAESITGVITSAACK